MARQYSIGNLLLQPGGFKAFIPTDFPPKNGYDFDSSTLHLAFEATHQLARLDGSARLLPDLDFFLMMYLRKDAAASSQIEGTRATLLDAIEAGVKIPDGGSSDVDDILHYIKALRYGMNRVREFPVSLRFICELHRELLEGARTSHFAAPGEFRTTQNWLDGTRPDNARFVPPPADELENALNQLEKFIHEEDLIPANCQSRSHSRPIRDAASIPRWQWTNRPYAYSFLSLAIGVSGTTRFVSFCLL